MSPRPLSIAVLLVALSASTASADALPFSQAVPLGTTGQLFPLSVANDGTDLVVLIGTTRHALEGVQAHSVSFSPESLAGGVAVGIVRLETDHGLHAILVGARRASPVVIWSDYTSLTGDPGERRGYALRVMDAAETGKELAVFETHEGVSGCNGQSVPVRPRRLNPKTLALGAPAALVEAPEPPEAGTDARIVMDTTVPEGFATSPRHFPLRSRWSTLGADAGALNPLPGAQALLDRDPNTGLALPGEPARLVFGVSGGGARVRAIAFTVSARGRGAVPQSIEVQGDTGDWIHAQLTPDANGPVRHWLTLPEPKAWSCLEIKIGARPAGSQLAIAEIEAFTDLDAADGISGLVSRVITDERGGMDAAKLLVSLGDAGIRELDQAWERLGPSGKRRTVIAVAHRAEESALARQVLLRAASEGDADLSERAMAPLLRAGSRAFAELMTVAKTGSAQADAAVRAVGESRHPEAVASLLALLSTEAGTDRAEVRNALRVALSSQSEPGSAAVQGWMAATPTAEAMAAALDALSQPGTLAEALTIWRALAALPLEFTQIWRTIGAAARLGPEAGVDAWLEQLVGEDERWMVRDAALASLWARQAAGAEAAALARLADEYPRVRARAVGIVATLPAHRTALETVFAQDAWPMVRARILDEAPEERSDAPLAMAGLRDGSPQVRVAAIRALSRSGRASAWPEVAKLVVSNDEWPTVMSAALEFAAHACIGAAVPELRKVLQRGLKPNAWSPDVDLAMEAIDVLGRIGTPEAHAVLATVQRADQPPPVRQAAARAMTAGACGVTTGTPPSGVSAAP